jgi:hypothetical protein
MSAFIQRHTDQLPGGERAGVDIDPVRQHFRFLNRRVAVHDDCYCLLTRATRHSRKINGYNGQRQGAKNCRDVPNISVLEAGYTVRPIPEHWRPQPRTDPAYDDLGTERPDPRGHVVLEAIVQYCRHHHADDEQDQKADETHPDHICLPCSLTHVVISNSSLRHRNCEGNRNTRV